MQDVVATVNAKPITQNELDSTMQIYALEIHRKTRDQLSAEELEEVRSMAMEKLIARELIFQAALAEGIVATEDAVLEEERKLIEGYPSEDDFFAQLEKAGMDPAFYHRMIRQDLTVNLMTAEKLKQIPEAPDEKVEQIYRDYPGKMKLPAKARASHILVTPEEGEAERARERIEQIRERATVENFAQLAAENSDCPSAQAGGDLGFFSQGQMVESFEEAAFGQPLGELGPVVETPYGYHLILVHEREEETPLSLEEASDKIRRFLHEESGAKLLKDWVAQLRQDARIEILR